MDVLTSYYKTARAPQQGYKSILKMPTRIEEGKDKYCLMSYEWNFDETGTPIAKSPMEFWVSCYTDVGYLTDADDLKSQTGYVFILNGGVVDWKSAEQTVFATSSAEAKYIVAVDGSKEVVWVRKFISKLAVVPTIEEPISMCCDNTGAIDIANESGITKGARHLRAKVHYLREVIEYSDVKLEKVYTDDNFADPFIKSLAFPKHSEHTRNIEMFPASSFIAVVGVRRHGELRLGWSVGDDGGGCLRLVVVGSSGELFLRELVLLNVSSLVDVDLKYSISYKEFVIFAEEIFRGLSKSLGHVENITYGDHCLELLSRLKAGSDKSNDD
nr:hypothetical protein [Tanacetum cinerariifolium]